MVPSVYTQISKEIGWTGTATIPTPDEARDLYNKVVLGENIEAFRKVFRIHRFAPGPTTDQEVEALQINCDALKRGTDIFQNRETA